MNRKRGNNEILVRKGPDYAKRIYWLIFVVVVCALAVAGARAIVPHLPSQVMFREEMEKSEELNNQLIDRRLQEHAEFMRRLDGEPAQPVHQIESPPYGQSDGEVKRKSSVEARTTVKIESSESQPPKRPLRPWTDKSGKFSIRASLKSYGVGKVKLTKEDGSVISVDFNQLSQPDQEYAMSLSYLNPALLS